MLDGNMVNKNISTNGPVNTMTNEEGYWAAYVYTMVIPYLDDDGKITGDRDELFKTAMLGNLGVTIDEVGLFVGFGEKYGVFSVDRSSGSPIISYPYYEGEDGFKYYGNGTERGPL